MKFDSYRRDWERMGAEDPMWAVLTQRDKRGGSWSAEEFFRLGHQDVDRLERRLAECGLAPRRDSALDFGCGVGRVTQALAARFERVAGVDISSTMIEHARRLNGIGERVEFHVNPRPDLSLFADARFDLVHSVITIQHIPGEISPAYLREFVRVLRPGGVLAIQIPAAFTNTPKGRLMRALPRPVRRALRRAVMRDPIEMHLLPRGRVERVLSEAGADVVRVFEDGSAGPDYVSWFYYARRRDDRG